MIPMLLVREHTVNARSFDQACQIVCKENKKEGFLLEIILLRLDYDSTFIYPSYIFRLEYTTLTSKRSKDET